MIAGLLLALATVGPPAPTAPRSHTVFVDWDAETKTCIPKVNGVETGDVASDAGKAALVTALPDKGLPLHLTGGTDVPYACTSAIVDALKGAGYYGGIILIAQPLPPRKLHP